MSSQPLRWISLLVVSSGCRQLLGFEEIALGDGGPGGDGTPVTDGPMPDDPPGQFCYGTAPIRPCFATEPSGTTQLSGMFDTGSCPGTTLMLDGRETCVFAARDIVIDGAMRVLGPRPLVLVGSFSLSVQASGTIDLSSSAAGAGAGAQPTECTDSETGAANQDGGGGGSFAGEGGDGGRGAGGIAGGQAADRVATIQFRGGCKGASGPLGNPGGPGGGAVYLIADTVTIAGTIIATGGGGRGAPASGGGGGGGTGGYIGVDAPTVAIGAGAVLVATGGGGGGGGCAGQPGSDGADADAKKNVLAFGGPGAPAGGGDGGEGGFAVQVEADNGESTNVTGCAAGGGGGGVGAIQFVQSGSCSASTCLPND